MNASPIGDETWSIFDLYPSPPLELPVFEPLRLIGGAATPTDDKPSRMRRRRKRAKERDDLKKRRLTAEQVISFLEKNFVEEPTLRSERKVQLAVEIGLDPRQVAVWFQNRRARMKSKQVEERCDTLRGMLERLETEKCKLESEVGELKERLAEAQHEIIKLREIQACSASLSPNPCPSDSFNAGLMFEDEAEVHRPDYVVFTPDYGSQFIKDNWDYPYFGLM